MVAYRYHLCGKFRPEKQPKRSEGHNKMMLGIEIPCPFIRLDEESARNDGCFVYRFERYGKDVVLAIYPTEDSERPFGVYSYEFFLRMGGVVYQIPDFAIINFDPSSMDPYELADLITMMTQSIQNDDRWNVSKHKINVSFNRLFPTLEEGRSIYIDSQSYKIISMDVIPA